MECLQLVAQLKEKVRGKPFIFIYLDHRWNMTGYFPTSNPASLSPSASHSHLSSTHPQMPPSLPNLSPAFHPAFLTMIDSNKTR